jgi:Type IV pilus assembly protein PilM
MKHGFLRWLTGTPPATVGAWWNDSALCLVRINDQAETQSRIHVAYDALIQAFQGGSGSFDVGRINVLKSSLDQVGLPPYQLALAVPSADVFIQTIRVPAKLDDDALAQLAVVEAVSNLPVPPEEVCADFVRVKLDEKSGQEVVRIAFCRREIIDGLMFITDEAGVSLAQVDRDLQAFHDAICWLRENTEGKTVAYPMVNLIMEQSPFVLVARDSLDLLHYPIDIENSDVTEQLRACTRRAGMSDLQDVKELIVVREIDAPLTEPDFNADLRVDVTRLNPFEVLGIRDQIPLAPFLAALGMAIRKSCE